MAHEFILLVMSALMMGVLGGAHCVGMCGGIVCALCYSCPQKSQKSWQPFLYQLSYSFGRITTYTLLGALTGVIGVLLSRKLGSSGGYLLRYVASILIILVGFYIAGWWRLIASLEKFGKVIWQPLSKLTRYLLPVTNMKYAFALGGLWGLLPCGLVYSALLYSLSAGTWYGGASVMFFFGLGTLPALLLVGSAMQSYQHFLAKKWVKQASGLTMIVFGLGSFALLLMHHSTIQGCANCHG